MFTIPRGFASFEKIAQLSDLQDRASRQLRDQSCQQAFRPGKLGPPSRPAVHHGTPRIDEGRRSAPRSVLGLVLHEPAAPSSHGVFHDEPPTGSLRPAVTGARQVLARSISANPYPLCDTRARIFNRYIFEEDGTNRAHSLLAASTLWHRQHRSSNALISLQVPHMKKKETKCVI